MLIKRAYGLSSERGVRVNFPSSKLLPLLGFTVVGDFGAVRLGSPGNRADVGRSEGWSEFGYRARLKFYSSSKDRN